MYKWVPEDDAFEEMGSLKTCRKQFALVQVDKNIYAVGGCNEEGNLTSVERYNEEDDEWETVSKMPKSLR